MAILRLFASIREAAGNKSQLQIKAGTISELLDLAGDELGELFKEQIQICRIWLNGKPAELSAELSADDEVALLPPVSGGNFSASEFTHDSGHPLLPAPMNIGMISLHTSPFLQPGQGDAGGLNVYVRQLAFALAHLGHNCTIYVRRTSADQPDFQYIEPGVNLAHITAGDFNLTLKELPAIIEEFAAALIERLYESDGQIDILHANYWISAAAAHIAKHQLNIPLVTTFHTLGKVKEQVGEWVAAERITAEEHISHCSEAVSATSDAEVKDLLNLYSVSPERIFKASAGVNHAFFFPGNQEEARKALELKRDDPVLLFVGRMQPLKRFDIAVGALAAVSRQYKNAQLLAVGSPSGPDGKKALAQALAKAEDLNVRQKIRLVAPQPHHLLSTYYRAADLVLMPSLSESFGLVALEASACGTPVVASNVGGLANIVDHNRTGLLVEGNDPQAYAEAVHTVLSQPVKSAEMALDAADKASSYSWFFTAKKLEQLYARCLSTALLDC